MAAIPVSTGNGTTQSPRNAPNAQSRTTGTNANSDWWNKYLASYNRPTTIRSADWYAQQAAARRNADAIAEAQRKAEEDRLRREAIARQRAIDAARARAEAQAAAQQKPNSSPADAAKMAEMEAEQNAPTWGQRFLDWLQSPAPKPFTPGLDAQGRKIDENGNLIDDDGKPLTTDTNGVNPNRGEERPGYIQQPVMDRNGNVTGYKYIKLMSPSQVTAADMTAGTQNGPTGRMSPSQADRLAREGGFGSIYEEISGLEASFARRKSQAAVEAWGEPKVGADGELDWSGTNKEYLGLNPGYIVAPTLNRPAPDAPYKEWVKYRDALQKQIRVPLYTEASVFDEFNNMGKAGIKDLQRSFIAARLYDTNDPVSLGNISTKDIDFMRTLMERANINGTTWQDQLAIVMQEAEQAKRQSGYGGGGGGGGGGAGGTTVYTQIQYTQTSMAQGRALLISVLKDALGRYPTDDELGRFIDMLNKAEAKSPTKTVTRTTTGEGRTRSVARTTPSEVDPQAMAEEFAQSIGGGKPYEANARDRYIAALLDSMGGTSV